MIYKLLVIAKNTLTETLRQPVYAVIIAFSLFLFFMSPSIAMYTLDEDIKMLREIGLSTLVLTGLFIAIFSATAAVTEEIETKTITTVLSKPVGRPTFILGKFLGVTAAVVLAHYICTTALLMAVRHGVLETATDTHDWPVIATAAAVVVVGLIILVTVNLPSGSGQVAEPDVSPRQEVANIDSGSNPVGSNTQSKGTSEMQPPKEDVAPKEPAQSAVAVSDDVGNLDLKLRLKAGQKHRLRLYRETNSSQTIEGRKIDENLINTMGLEFEAEEVDPNGIIRLKVTYLTIHDVTITERGRREYDSTKPDVATNNRGGVLFSAMIGQSFIAKVTTKGEIVELEGLNEMYQRMAEPIVKWDEEDAKRRARMPGRTVTFAPIEERIESRKKYLEMHSRTGQRAIREMLGSVIVPFRREPVALGGSWQARSTLSMGGSTIIGLYDCTYNLREAKQESVLVDIGSKIGLDDEPVPGGEGPDSPRVTLTGSCQGSLEIDPSTGWLLHKNVTLNYSGEIKRPPTERSPQGSTMGMSIEIVTTVEPIE